jgi:hypothetical protein
MKLLTGLCGVALALSASAALANDSMGQLAAGGLVFLNNDQIEMASEDLTVGPDEIRVVYRFHNNATTDQHILVAFPMPDITGSTDMGVIIPTEDSDNIFDFATTFDGKPVAATLHQYAFANNIDYSAELKRLGVPLLPYGEKTRVAIAALTSADQQKLVSLGLIYGSDAAGTEFDRTPIWTLRSTYRWEASFPAGADAAVVHTYKPSVGISNGVYFVPAKDAAADDPANTRLAEFKTTYCVTDAMVETLRQSAEPTQDMYPFGIPYTENWLSYIWSTGNNWFGPIGHFTLTVDSGSPQNLVAFCGEGIKQTGATTYFFTATDWYPPDHELEILLVKRDEE